MENNRPPKAALPKVLPKRWRTIPGAHPAHLVGQWCIGKFLCRKAIGCRSKLYITARPKRIQKSITPVTILVIMAQVGRVATSTCCTSMKDTHMASIGFLLGAVVLFLFMTMGQLVPNLLLVLP